MVFALALTLGLLSPTSASGNPDHFAGDYFMFAKAAGDDPVSPNPNRESYEPACDITNNGQAEVSGSTSFFYGRIHSNADLVNSGDDSTFVETASTNPELTYGVTDNAPPTSSPGSTTPAPPRAPESAAEHDEATQRDTQKRSGASREAPEGAPGLAVRATC